MSLYDELIALVAKYAPTKSDAVPVAAGQKAQSGADALANARAYLHPIDGSVQWADKASQEKSDRAAAELVLLPNEDPVLAEILARSGDDSRADWAGRTADDWVATVGGIKNKPSGDE